MNQDIASLRTDYTLKALLEEQVEKCPIDQFSVWWAEAIASQLLEPNAFTLATASTDGLPAARIVLLKNVQKDGFVFFTNYSSYKGMQLAENPKACAVFFWKELQRQVRITGMVKKISEAESDEYFFSRPIESQYGAISSPQSQVIESREWLENAYENRKNSSEKIERPSHWGGYIISPIILEFWQGRPSRLHDRLQYTLIDTGEWKIERLAP